MKSDDCLSVCSDPRWHHGYVLRSTFFEWLVTKAGDRSGAWGIAAVVFIFFGALAAVLWWIFARP
ncbi:hypothetical protein KRZ98_08820 [Sphingobium sp. AS12]|uniref:hypothetical protein n=1 Tax=Sphingobium sp. AS12 TaxID=2849495 RepID=UPI001C314F0C|nr:hypothetical protein [Sphingobium sp. AS12]MBV2148386.1 hypothetical protein [Sphingobium sp. AS12]